MHYQIDMSGNQRLLDLLDEQAFAAELGEQLVLHPVAGRADRYDLDRSVRGEVGVSPQPNDRQRGRSGAAPSGCRGFRTRKWRDGTDILVAARSTPLQQVRTPRSAGHFLLVGRSAGGFAELSHLEMLNAP